MHNAYFEYTEPKNEPVLNYGPGSAERKALQQTLAEMKSSQRDIPMYINGKEVRGDKRKRYALPMKQRICLAIIMRVAPSM